jgi:hypothetical protein
MESEQDLKARKTWWSQNDDTWALMGALETVFRPSLKITPLLPECCQSLPTRISHGRRQFWERLMQGAMHAITSKGIPDWEIDGQALPILQQIKASELKASHERLMQLC